MRNKRTTYAFGVTTLAASLLLAVQLAAPVRAQQSNRQEVVTVTPGDLADKPDRFYGQRVRITGEVEDVYSRSVFAIDEDKVWSTARDVLVLNPNAADRVDDDDKVTVEGIVRPFSHADIDRYVTWYGWQWDLPELFGRRFERRPVIIAESIVGTDNRQFVLEMDRVRASTADYAKQRPVTRMTPQTVLYLTPDHLAANPGWYYGRTVSLTGDVEDRFGSRVFSIDQDHFWSTGEDVLVVASRPLLENFEDRGYVRVQGEVVRFARSEVQRVLDRDNMPFDWFWMDYEDRPVIMATSVTGPMGRDLTRGGK